MREIKLAFAGEIFSIKFKDNRAFSAYLKRHGGFLTDGDPCFSLIFNDTNGRNNLFSVSINKKEAGKIIGTKNKELLERSFTSRRLRIRMNQAIGLENYLRVFFSQYLLRYDGFLLHASTIGYKNKAYVFTGPSGAGKSTIAGISRDKLILTDDMVAIRRQQGRYYAYATPFGVQRGGTGNTRLSIAGIYCISHAEKTTCSGIPRLSAFKKIMANMVVMGAETKDLQIDKLFDTCYNLVRQTPCFALPFNKNEDIWRVVKDGE